MTDLFAPRVGGILGAGSAVLDQVVEATRGSDGQHSDAVVEDPAGACLAWAS